MSAWSEVMTPSQTLGPLYGFALMYEGSEAAVDPSSPGALEVRGSVLDGKGDPVCYPECMVEIWEGEQFARTRTDADGQFRAVLRKPESTSLPDGRVQAPFYNVTILARGLLKQVATRMYFPDEAANASDPVLSMVPEERRETLIAKRTAEGGLRFDVRLQGEHETVIFAF